MDIGNRIRIQRHKLNIKQDQLAEGIISTSYLSKIENGSKEASNEVIEMLCRKIGISLYKTEDELETEKKVHNWILLILKVEDRNKIKKIYNELLISESLRDNDYLDTLFVICKIRYFIINNIHKDAEYIIEKLRNVENLFDSLQNYYWNKFRGNYYFSTKNYTEALTKYYQAEVYSSNLKLNILETADLHYSIGITSNYLFKHTTCIEHSRRALEIYSKEFNIQRMAECHVNLGVVYKRTGEHISALEEYQYAEKMANHLHNERLIYIANYNIAQLLLEKKNYEESYKYFKSCLQYAEDLNSKLMCICALMKANFEEKNFQTSKSYAVEGIKLIANNPLNDSTEILEKSLEFNIFNHFFNKEHEQLQYLIKKQLLPLLKSRNGEKELSFYYNFLGSYFKSINKYKEATSMYEKSIEHLKSTHLN